VTRFELDRPEASAAADGYLLLPRPLFTRLPFSYRVVPLRARVALLAVVERVTSRSGGFPEWPIEASLDTPTEAHPYAGRRAAVLLTHDIDSRGELQLIDSVRALEAERGLVSSFGFVPRESWPDERRARAIVDAGGEVYWHDIGHDARLPYLGIDGIRRAFDEVARGSPWATRIMRAFRAGQLLVSADLIAVVAERFAIDMSIPDTERGGPYGGVHGCGTVRPFRWRGLLELPATMPQDAFVRHVYRMTPPEIDALWAAKLDHIRAVGGCAVLSVHPRWIIDRDLALLGCYTRLLDRIAADDDLFVTTPSGVEAVLAAAGPWTAAPELVAPPA
jgi:hypothetical protein